MARLSSDGVTLSRRCVNAQRWEAEQRLDGVPMFTAIRARGRWRLRPPSSTQVIGGCRTLDQAWGYAAPASDGCMIA
jgi:hypothetical protein